MNERPFILWKCAASLDGRIAAADGSSKWITSAEARADGHRLRAECGAVMPGGEPLGDLAGSPRCIEASASGLRPRARLTAKTSRVVGSVVSLASRFTPM